MSEEPDDAADGAIRDTGRPADRQETLIAALRRDAQIREEELAGLRDRLEAAEHVSGDFYLVAAGPPHPRVAEFAYGTLSDDLCMPAARID